MLRRDVADPSRSWDVIFSRSLYVGARRVYIPFRKCRWALGSVGASICLGSRGPFEDHRIPDQVSVPEDYFETL